MKKIKLALACLIITLFWGCEKGEQDVQQSITITNPAGGEQWKKGNSYTVTWTSEGINGDVEIRLDYPGVSNTLGYTDIANGQFTFIIPSNFPSRNDWAVAVTAFGVTPSGGDIYDWSEKITISSDASSTGPFAYFPFSGNAEDASGNGFHGSVSDAILCSDKNGNSNSAYEFSNSYISVSSNALNDLTSGTVSAFIYRDENNKQHTILDKTITNQINYFQWIVDQDNTIRVIIDKKYNEAGNVFRSNAKLTSKTWYHIATTWDGTKLKIFLNGQLDAEYDCTATIPNANRSLLIGKVDNNTAYMKGRLDEIRIYNIALSLSDIQQLANQK